MQFVVVCPTRHLPLSSPLKLGSTAREYHPVTPPIRIRIRRRAGNVFAGAVSASPAAAPSPPLPNTLVVLFSNLIGAVKEVVKWARELPFPCAVFFEALRALGWSAPARTFAPRPPAAVHHLATTLRTHTHAFLAWMSLPSRFVEGPAELCFPPPGHSEGSSSVNACSFAPVGGWFTECARLGPALASSSTPSPPPCCSAWSAAMPVCLLRNDPVRLLARATTYTSTHPLSAPAAVSQWRLAPPRPSVPHTLGSRSPHVCRRGEGGEVTPAAFTCDTFAPNSHWRRVAIVSAGDRLILPLASLLSPALCPVLVTYVFGIIDY
ncbi:hypothetical protein B0H11DRAFT_2287671 [Mycena galericulata]|nr:hypothetical protein B0H11DRAFT_2287671 [Mycena galericulata]